MSRLAGEGLKPFKATEFWWLCDQLGSPGSLLGRSAQDLASALGSVPGWAERIAALVDRATAVAFELERLEASGLSVLNPFDAQYPPAFVARLGVRAPPLLYVAGAPGLLNRAGLGAVGSRDVSFEGGQVAIEVGRRAVGMGVSLVSGGARGVDRLAMNAALDAGGTVVAMLAGSLAATVAKPELRRALRRGVTVLCSPYGSDVAFSAGNALGRNKLIYAQSLRTVVVACESARGGTWAGATEALRGEFGPVSVWRGPGEGDGNAGLEAMGATPIRSMEEVQP
ncbi:MAG: DNA-processing protein DprA [Acidimicrobiales bacterium]